MTLSQLYGDVSGMQQTLLQSHCSRLDRCEWRAARGSGSESDGRIGAAQRVRGAHPLGLSSARPCTTTLTTMATLQATRKAINLAPTAAVRASGVPAAARLNLRAVAGEADHGHGHGHGAQAPRSDKPARWASRAALSPFGLAHATKVNGEPAPPALGPAPFGPAPRGLHRASRGRCSAGECDRGSLGDSAGGQRRLGARRARPWRGGAGCSRGAEQGGEPCHRRA